MLNVIRVWVCMDKLAKVRINTSNVKILDKTKFMLIDMN